jgi:hypothetical protein
MPSAPEGEWTPDQMQILDSIRDQLAENRRSLEELANLAGCSIRDTLDALEVLRVEGIRISLQEPYEMEP